MSGQPCSDRDRLLALLRERSFARRKVTLASGRESDFFIDCKQTVLTAEGHALVGSLLFEAIGKLPTVTLVAPLASIGGVAGVELGGCPLASAVSLISFQRGVGIDAVYVRKDAKDHGSKRLLEGDSTLQKGAALAIVEDVVTTGGSTLKAAAKLRDAGYVVVGVAAVVDRLEGGREAIEAEGLPLVTLYTRLDFIPAT